MGTMILQLSAALLLTATLAYLAHRRGYTTGHAHGLADGRAETQQLTYAEGYSTGTWEGRLKERAEIATSSRKVYEQGYEDALAAVAGMNYTAMLDEAETRLSA